MDNSADQRGPAAPETAVSDEVRLDCVPPTVIVELTNVCDLSCPLCTTAMGMHRAKGFMSRDTFERILADLVAVKPKPVISFNMSGEPLLHREVADFVDLATRQGHDTFISTNVGRLTRTLSARLIGAGLTAIHLCVDGATAEAHEAYRVGSDFEQIRQHCADFLAVRRELGSRRPRVTIQTLLTRLSVDQSSDILAWATEIGADDVFFKTLSLGTGLTREQQAAGTHLLPLEPELRRHRADSPAPCQHPRDHTLVYWNGDLGVCCVDFNNMAGLPNIEPAGLRATLAAPRVVAAREQGRRCELALCGVCQSRTSGPKGYRVDLAAAGS